MVTTPSSFRRTCFGMRRRHSHRAPSFLRLVKRYDFDTMYQVLADPTMSTRRWFEEEYSMLGENCLHTIMKYRPPVRVIVLLLKRLVEYGIAEPELSVDILGRTPLHYAVGYLCEPGVTQVLLTSSAGKLSLRAQDIDGRLPLHIAMRPYELVNPMRRPKKNRLPSTRVQRILKETVEILVFLCPQATLIKDDHRRTAVQYATTKDVDPSFHECIQTISQELRMAEAMTKSEKLLHDKRGMVVEFPSSSSTGNAADDDVSVLSFSASERKPFEP